MKTKFITLVVALICTLSTYAQDSYIGEIKMFAGTYAPIGWLFCRGQMLEIRQNQALYAVIGNIYGGDGRTTFALPDLQGRVVVGAGYGAGLTPRNLGVKDGKESVTLTIAQLPIHDHKQIVSATTGTLNTPNNNVLTAPASNVKMTGNVAGKPVNTFAPNSNTAIPLSNSVTVNGNGQAHDNMMPYITINYIICIEGIFPPRE